MTQILSRVKLLFRKDKELYTQLYRILGFYPKKIEYYRTAFAHRSQMYRNRKGRRMSNERLEFLGDAILEAIVSDIVFHHFETNNEGFLTNTRSKLVSRATLNELAEEMQITQFIKASAKQSVHNNNIAGNAFEALIGAIYLDQGYKVCFDFISKRIIGKIVNVDDVAQKEVNFKSKLLEYCQKNRIHIEFPSKNLNGSEDAPLFRTIAQIEGVMVGEGKGRTKKESEQLASKDALLHLRRSTKLKDAVFHAKEERISEEAYEYAAVPVIDEIEEEIQREKNEKAQRQKEKKQEQRQKEQRNEQHSQRSNDNRLKPQTQETAEAEVKADKPSNETTKERQQKRSHNIEEPAATPADSNSAPEHINKEIPAETPEPAATASDDSAPASSDKKPARRRGRRNKTTRLADAIPNSANADTTESSTEVQVTTPDVEPAPAAIDAPTAEAAAAETVPQPKRRRGRPRKTEKPDTNDEAPAEKPASRRGRPRRSKSADASADTKPAEPVSE